MVKNVFISLLGFVILAACQQNNAAAQSKPDSFKASFSNVQARWESAFNALDEQLEMCSAQKKTNTATPPSLQNIRQQGLTERQFKVGLFLLSQDLDRSCAREATNNAAYELGVYNHFIHENLEKVQANNLMPDSEFHTWNDYTGNAEILFEEDILETQRLRDEIGDLSEAQDQFMRDLVNNQPFDPLKLSERL